MKSRRTASPCKESDVVHHESPTGDMSSTSALRRRHFRLSPVTALVIAAAGLALGVGIETDHFGCRLTEAKTLRPAQAVDISLQRLMRTRIIGRLDRERRMIDPLAMNMSAIDTELIRAREHPLYVRIKGMMTNHLFINGYDRVPVTVTEDPNDPMLSLDTVAALHTYIRSVRASFPVSNEKVVAFLNDQEEILGESLVARRGAGRYDVVLSFLIQLLCEFPDELEPVTSVVTFVPVPTEEIERGLRGKSQVRGQPEQ